MNTIFTMMLLFIATNSFVISQTYVSNPINQNSRIGIADLSTYQDKVAIVTMVFSDTVLQIYANKEDKWTALPNFVLENGVERKIPYNSYNQYIRNKIHFDSKGNIWVLAYDGLYRFDEILQEWSYFAVPNVNKNVTSYKYFTIDSLDNVWTIAEVYRGTATEYADSNTFGDTNYIHLQTELYMLKDGAFTRFFEDTSTSPLRFNSYAYQYYADINSNSLTDGIMIRNYSSKPFKDLIHVKSNGDIIDYQLPTTDLDLYSPVMKYTNYLYNDKKNNLWALMDRAYAGGYNLKQGIGTCCAGVSKLENSNWISYNNIDNEMPFTIVGSEVKYHIPMFVSELENNELLFIMKEGQFNNGENPKLYKLKSDNKFYRDYWKPYLEAATVYRSDPQRVSEQTMINIIEIFKNETFLEKEFVPLYGMKTDAGGNLWIWGSQFIIKAPMNATTSITESIKKPTDIYPNPGNKSIRLSNISNDIVKIEILNLTGSIVRTVSENSTEISVSDLASGMYFVKIYFQNGKLDVQKFVKE